MDQATATDEVIDLIAGIELHRQEAGKASDPAAARNEALRKLHELLEREREALQTHGPGTRHAANIETVMSQIARMKNLAGGASQHASSGDQRPHRHQVASQSAARNFPRNKGRRTMGRNER